MPRQAERAHFAIGAAARKGRRGVAGPEHLQPANVVDDVLGDGAARSVPLTPLRSAAGISDLNGKGERQTADTSGHWRPVAGARRASAAPSQATAACVVRHPAFCLLPSAFDFCFLPPADCLLPPVSPPASPYRRAFSA